MDRQLIAGRGEPPDGRSKICGLDSGRPADFAERGNPGRKTVPYLIPAVLSALALAVAAIGFRSAHRFKRPALFKTGAIVAAVGLMLLWLLPWWAIARDAGAWAMPLMVAALVVAVSVLGAGLSTMARAATGNQDSPADRIVQDIITLNDLP
ncbi:MAG TPA: hypothetical protein VFU20_07185 [Sphingomicrobium sp.]|nr:hypothetical protein [Sphingomicrobium sp.]